MAVKEFVTMVAATAVTMTMVNGGYVDYGDDDGGDDVEVTTATMTTTMMTMKTTMTTTFFGNLTSNKRDIDIAFKHKKSCLG